MQVAVYAGLAAAGVVVAGIVLWALARVRRPRRIGTPEDAADAADALPGFVTAGAVVGSDGLAAIAVDGAGRVVAMARRGKRIMVREIDWAAVHASPRGMVIETGDRRLGTVTVTGVDHLDIRRLAPVLARR